MNNTNNPSFTNNFIFIFLMAILCYIQATDITVTVAKSGHNKISCLYGERSRPCLSLDYVFSHLLSRFSFHSHISISILEGDYSFTLNNVITSTHCQSINIIGKSKNNTTISCGVNAGFAFRSISQVKIANINLTNCGSIRKSTSVDLDHDYPNTTLPLSAALYFTYCKDVQMVNVIVQNSNSTGVVMYNTHGNLLVEGSSFIGNGNQSNYPPSNGGFYVEFVYCDPGKVDKNCVHKKNSHAKYYFTSSHFRSNIAWNDFGGTLFYEPHKTKYYSFGRGGGLAIVFKGNASNNTIRIDNCTFNENQASRGGGLFIEFEDFSKNNTVNISNTNFNNNSVNAPKRGYGTAGGGASVGYVIYEQNSVEFNSVLFENCHFTENKAFWGGGFGMYIPSEPNVIDATNSLCFKRCQWRANKALLGSAVDLHHWPIHITGAKMPVKFTACLFYKNNEELTNTQLYNIVSIKVLREIGEDSFGAGALYANGIPITFEESVKFISNNGSALAIHGTTASFYDNCHAHFENNNAWIGGAIALLGTSKMWIYPQTVFHFIGNKAELRGGAIFALQTSRHDLLTGRNCFIQYSDLSVSSPYKWKTNFTFDNNYAPTGSSIFTTTLLPCALGESFKDLENNTFNALNWTHVFSYDILDRNTIATEVSNITVDSKYSSSNPFGIIPGKYTKLPIKTVDDKNVDISRSLWLVSNNPKAVRVGWGITDNSFIIMTGRPNSETTIEIATDSSNAVSAKLPVKMMECPPGYYFDLDKNQICQCSYFNDDQRLEGVLSCDSETFTANITRGYWAGYLSPTPTDSNLVTGQCPRHFCKQKEQQISLPLTNNIKKLDEFFCSPSNRTGTLCGRCIKDYGIAINSIYYDCVNCSDSLRGLMIYVSSEFIPLTVFVWLILYFDYNPHSGISSLIVLYFQIFNVLNIYSDEHVDPPRGTYSILRYIVKFYSIWNLEFVGSIFLHPYCISSHLNIMNILLIKYFTGIYPFILYFLLKKVGFCNCCCKHGRAAECCTFICKCKYENGLAAICTLVFTKFVVISGQILSPKTLHGPGSQHSNLTVTVAWLNGNLPYWGTDHLWHIAITIPFLIFVSITVIRLFCYPLYLKWDELLPKRITQLIAILCENNCICRGCKSVIKSYQEPFKERLQWYAGVLFIYRIAIVLVFCFTVGASSIFLITIFSMFLIIITAVYQPYKEYRDYIVAVLCVSNIVLINICSFNNLHYTEIQINSDLRLYLWLQLFLVLIPLPVYIFFICKSFPWQRWNQYILLCCKKIRGATLTPSDRPLITETPPEPPNERTTLF